MDMKYKVLLFCLFILVFSIPYILNTTTLTESITLISEEDRSLIITDPKILSSKSYEINYTKGLTGIYNINKMVFQDINTAENYTQLSLEEVKPFITNETSLKIEDYDGQHFASIGIETGSVVGYIVVVRREGEIIYGHGSNLENLIKVTEWFISRY
jgi:hypothetical protein